MSGKGAVRWRWWRYTAARRARSGRRWWSRRWSLLRFCLWRLRGGRCRFEALEMMGSGRDREIRYGEVRRGLTSFCPAAVGSRWRSITTLGTASARRAEPSGTEKTGGLRYDPQAQSLVCLPTQTRRAGISMALRWGSGHASGWWFRTFSWGAGNRESCSSHRLWHHIFDLFPASASAQIDTDTAAFCCAMISTGSCQHCRPREKKTLLSRRIGQPSNPHVTSAKLHELGWSREETAQIRAPVGNSPKPGMRILWHSPCWQKSPCTSPSWGGFMPAPVVLILAAGVESAFSPPGEIPISVSAGAVPGGCALSLAIWRKRENFRLAIEPQITTNDLRLMLRLALPAEE